MVTSALPLLLRPGNLLIFDRGFFLVPAAFASTQTSDWNTSISAKNQKLPITRHLIVPIVNVEKALITSRSKITAIATEAALKFVENRIGFVADNCHCVSVQSESKNLKWGSLQVTEPRWQLLMHVNRPDRSRFHMAIPQSQCHIVTRQQVPARSIG